jgi:hypothetical protein
MQSCLLSQSKVLILRDINGCFICRVFTEIGTCTFKFHQHLLMKNGKYLLEKICKYCMFCLNIE